MQEITDLTTSIPLLLAQWLGINILGFFLARSTQSKIEKWIDSAKVGSWQVALLAIAPILVVATPLLAYAATSKQGWVLAAIPPFCYHFIRQVMQYLASKDIVIFGYRPEANQSEDLTKALWLLTNVFIGFQLVTNDAAKAFDITWGYQLTLAGFLAGLFGLIFNAQELWNAAKKHKPSALSLGVLGILLIGFGVFAHTQVPLQHRVLSDESSWESMGLQMTYAPWSEKGSVCNQGTFDEQGKLTCFDRVNNFKGKFTPFVYDLVAYFVEPSRDSALWVNLPIYLLSLAFLFYGVFVLSGRETTALMAVIFMGALPTMLFQARAASTEVLYALLFNILLVVFGLLLPKFKMRHLWLVLPLLGMFAGTRLDTVFCFGAVYFILWKFLLERPGRLWWFTFCLILACLPSITVIAAYKGYDFQGGQYDAFSLYNFFVNFSTNLQVMLGLEVDYDGMWKWPFLTTQTVILYLGAIFILVQASLSGRHRFQVIAGLLFFIQAILIMVNVSGNFTIDINQRYVLVAYPLFAIICAYFFADVRDRFFAKSKWSKKQFWIIAGSSLLGLILIYKTSIAGVAKFLALKSLKASGAIVDFSAPLSEYDLNLEIASQMPTVMSTFFASVWIIVPFIALLGWTLYKLRGTLSGHSAQGKKEAWLLFTFVLALNGSLLWAYHSQFNGNVMYRHNGLLIEEKFLHEHLRKLPPKSVFVYARPWQMLCSRLNGISEDRLLSWSPQEWAEWNNKSGGNIYLVRGQDAWGDLNRGGRVVGFKTTEKAQQVLEKYDYEEILTNSELFGYPLTVYHLKSYKGMNPFRSQMIFKAQNPEIASNQSLVFEFQKFFAGTVKIDIFDAKGNALASRDFQNNEIWKPSINLGPGMNELHVKMTYPDGQSQEEIYEIFNRTNGSILLTELDPSPWAQEWGKPEKNRTVNSNPLKVKGRTYTFGIGTHAQSDLHYALSGKFQTFSFAVGLDDEDMGGDGVIYRVIADGKILWESGPMFSAETMSAQVSVAGVQDLHLQVDRRGNKDFDHANWLDAWLAP